MLRAKPRCLSVCLSESSCFPKKLVSVCLLPSPPTPNSCHLLPEACDNESRDCAVHEGEGMVAIGLASQLLSAFGFGGLEETLFQAHPFSLLPNLPLPFTDHETEQDCSGLGDTPSHLTEHPAMREVSTCS